MSEILSYKNILDDIKKFKSSGSRYGDEFNVLDTPSHKYFKILFYFGSEAEFGIGNSSGLLAPTWELFNKVGQNDNNYYDYNSAWAYLKLNDENERAEKLEQFVTLLSDINVHSPWYFSSIGGINDALERKSTEEGKFEMPENKKLTITCLPDAFDNRIGTLLELYRDITWSWIHKKEIIPSNLRKFDMAVYIFETPETNWHYENSIIAEDNSFNLPVSYKMLEFHDCEFGYNSIKSGWSDLNNQTGFSPTYTIDISYNDCYEISYNDVMMRKIGDVILTDLINGSENDNEYKSIAQSNNYDDWELDDKINPLNSIEDTTGLEENSKGTKNSNSLKLDKNVFVENATSQLAGHFKADIESKINRALLGNIYTLSLTKLDAQLGDLLSGNIIKTGMTVAQYAKTIGNSVKNTINKHKSLDNIFEDTENKVKLSSKRKIGGNIFSNKTLANNL